MTEVFRKTTHMPEPRRALTAAYAQALRKAVDYNNQSCDPNTLPQEALRWRDTAFEAIRLLEFVGAIEPGAIKVYAGSFTKAKGEF